MIELSVHLITYNNEDHIEDTLQSILKQKVSFDYEIVVGDDCSTDNTLQIINTYASKYPNRFNVLKNDSQLGILKNFKATLDRCKGKYIYDISGDDQLNTELSLQKMIDKLNANSNLGFIDSGYDRLDDKTGNVNKFINSFLINSSKNTYKEAILLGKVAPIGHCFNRELLYKHVDFDTYLKMDMSFEDYPILVDLVMQTDFERINESLHTYRVHDNSHSHRKNLKHLLSQRDEMKKLFDYFSKKYSFSDILKAQYYKDHYKHILFLAGYFEDKFLGKDTFKKVKQKGLKDYIHYWASQSKPFRKLISLRKKLF